MGEVADVLGGVLDQITPETWTVNTVDDHHGRHCALGWLAKVHFNCERGVGWNFGEPTFRKAASLLHEVIGEPVGGVVRYNNYGTYEDVVLMFKRGYELALERGL